MIVNNAKVSLLPNEALDEEYWVELNDLLDGYEDWYWCGEWRVRISEEDERGNWPFWV